MDKIPSYGELFTLEEFAQCVKSTLFIPYDGSGYFANETGYGHDAPVWPWPDKPPDWATHVMWFNK